MMEDKEKGWSEGCCWEAQGAGDTEVTVVIKMVRGPELESHSNPKQHPVRRVKHQPIIIILVSLAGAP